MLMHIFNVGVGMTFSGGLIDLFLFGILQGNAKTSWLWVVVVGIGYFIVYYFLFGFLIRKLDLKTPGREDSDEVRLYHRSDVEDKRRKNAEMGSGTPQRAAWTKFQKKYAGDLADGKISRMWTAARPV